MKEKDAATERTGSREAHGDPDPVRALRIWWRNLPFAARFAARRLLAQLGVGGPLPFRRTYLAFTHDVGIATLAFVLALYLQLGPGFLRANAALVAEGAAYIAVAASLAIWMLRLHRSLWCYASLQDMVTIVKAASLIQFLFIPAWALHPGLAAVPPTVLAIDWLTTITLLAAPRVASRLASSHRPGAGAARASGAVAGPRGDRGAASRLSPRRRARGGDRVRALEPATRPHGARFFYCGNRVKHYLITCRR